MGRATVRRQTAAAQHVRPKKRPKAEKKAAPDPNFPARIEDATSEQIARAMFAATDVSRLRRH